MKIIFLDFDGVLNNEIYLAHHTGKFDPKNIHELNRVLVATGAKVVVSSDWRYGLSVAQLDERLAREGVVPGVVIGATARATNFIPPPRGQEIANWLAEHPEVTDFVAIDDSQDLSLLPQESVMYTSELTGLTRDIAEWMISVLGPK